MHIKANTPLPSFSGGVIRYRLVYVDFFIGGLCGVLGEGHGGAGLADILAEKPRILGF